MNAQTIKIGNVADDIRKGSFKGNNRFWENCIHARIEVFEKTTYYLYLFVRLEFKIKIFLACDSKKVRNFSKIN